MKDRASHWCEAHEESPNYGNFLDFDTFNLYQANFWVIEPATRDHGRKGCSYVELVAISMDDQRPKWFVSHAWLEPIVRFMLCLKQHALLRQLSLQSAYWVCASTWSSLLEKFCFTLVLVVLVVAHFWKGRFWRTEYMFNQAVEHVLFRFTCRGERVICETHQKIPHLFITTGPTTSAASRNSVEKIGPKVHMRITSINSMRKSKKILGRRLSIVPSNCAWVSC